MLPVTVRMLPVEVGEHCAVGRHELYVWVKLQEHPVSDHLKECELIGREEPV